jgi:hypothetical protein
MVGVPLAETVHPAVHVLFEIRYNARKGCEKQSSTTAFALLPESMLIDLTATLHKFSV